MNSLWVGLGKFWLEYLGKRRSAARYPFREDEIVTPGLVLYVSPLFGALFLNLHPTHYGVGIAPDGRILNLRGGYNPLPAGRYIIHFIDKQNRVSAIPLAEEGTYDGYQVSLELVITYRVIDPIKAVEVQQAVNTLLVFIQSDLKQFIRSHNYNELMGGFEGSKIDDEQIVRYIKDQHASRHQISSLFFLADIVVEARLGDPHAPQMREEREIIQGEFDSSVELDQQNQELRKTMAAQVRKIENLEADVDALRTVVRMLEKQNIDGGKITKDTAIPPVDNKMPGAGNAKSAKVFIAYSKIDRDREVAEEIREILCEQECIPWMDVYNLLPGQDWQLEIQKNIRNSDFFIVILSNTSVSKKGFIQKEITIASSMLAEMPEGRIFIIPIKLDECTVPASLEKRQWLDWASVNSKELLLQAIKSIDN
jgi:hypothetical protein